MFKRLTFVLACFIALFGCSKLTVENYNKIKVGMDYNEVAQIIGSPTECSEVIGTKQCRWGDESKNIKITFVADRATLTLHNGLK
ncbi:DUF3862 domain-containing protein [Catenovulum sediminis]|uniref:DUF3862 domain-containing protein n=1 Tax=Catenovulum sediminis TaxID=1740262 RepID=A0ABV1RDA0_9ALTE